MEIDTTGLPCMDQDWLAEVLDFGLAALPEEPLSPNRAADRRQRAEELTQHVLANWAKRCETRGADDVEARTGRQDISPQIKEAIDDYVANRRRHGGFVTAVLENDLMMAFSRADSENRAHLFEIVKYCWNEIPAPCWGSPQAVKAWLAGKNDDEARTAQDMLSAATAEGMQATYARSQRDFVAELGLDDDY